MEEINLVNIATSRWDGRAKRFTKSCPGCEFLKVVDGEKRCYWGVDYKILGEEKILPYCQLTKKPSPRLAMLKSVLNQKSELEGISAS